MMYNSSLIDWIKSFKAKNWAEDFIIKIGLGEESVQLTALLIDVLLFAIIILVIDIVSRKILLRLVKWYVGRSKNHWDDYFYEQRVFRNLAHLLPAIIVVNYIPVLFDDVPWIIKGLQILVKIYIIVLLAIIINKALKAAENLMNSDLRMANSPLRTVSQVIRVLTIFGTIILLISLFSGVPITTLLGIFAGTSAILILIFQDTITGLLANFQITMYDLLRVGDWVTLEKYGVDGDVISLDLTTVKIRNFDKTISSVPAKAFVNDSFVNWRGMQEEGARRIKRNILIDISSIKYCSHQDIEDFSKIGLIAQYVTEKQKEIDEHNRLYNIDTTLRVNGRRQTNIGVYRAYILQYLKVSSKVNQNFSIMVRQLQPTAQGVPLEVYCFASTIVWNEYENVQADIFDHLYAATEYFGLRLYQAPSGRDVRFLTQKIQEE